MPPLTIKPSTNQKISIYIHFPWCIKKCPYCDFNSYQVNHHVPEQLYIQKLLADFDASLDLLSSTKHLELISIFFGGGTPSLLSGKAIATILNHINIKIPFNKHLEITLEVNPGTIEHSSMSDYKTAGITRISLGAQSFNDQQLSQLGRIHNAKHIAYSLKNIVKQNFNSFNIDLMYGLPKQTLDDALYDLRCALSYSPPHISWYQLTIEPNTLFYTHQPTTLPNEDTMWEMYNNGLHLLDLANYTNYETSAFAKHNHYCQHNLNYWQYGDYLGIGPGAHSKITLNNEEIFTILRLIKIKHPKNYLSNTNLHAIQEQNILTKQEIIFEFMLNNLRLQQGALKQDFLYKTNCKLHDIQVTLDLAVSKGLLTVTDERIKPTALGRKFLNDLQLLFI